MVATSAITTRQFVIGGISRWAKALQRVTVGRGEGRAGPLAEVL